MKTRDMILISLFAALTAIGAFLKINIGAVPFTFQFFFCAYAGVFLGSKKGSLSQIIYIAMGLIGIPIFANGGGITYVFNPTFGYLLGYFVCTFAIGYLTERMTEITFIKVFGAVLTGLFFVYLIGVPYLYMIIKLYLGKGDYSVQSALAAGFLPFIIPDIIKSFIVATSSILVLPRLRNAGYTTHVKKG
ncbi:biotin transporter BioY [Fusibacter ferrireducens]|uniref:Biotin transporter n=1 Tax=Fusibacter ferrireducens TaxID=2785058 RepID=A0ABR9ZYV2_9FIRM|nr:biotin transporter BioY [Fusibacter ferrireducens]MBF4695343.1 biotin transporter BioY [Fusibacter ferrireducens]